MSISFKRGQCYIGVALPMRTWFAYYSPAIKYWLQALRTAANCIQKHLHCKHLQIRIFGIRYRDMFVGLRGALAQRNVAVQSFSTRCEMVSISHFKHTCVQRANHKYWGLRCHSLQSVLMDTCTVANTIKLWFVLIFRNFCHFYELIYWRRFFFTCFEFQ